MVNLYACRLSCQNEKYLTSLAPNDFTECRKIFMAAPELEHEGVVYRIILFHEPPLVEHLCD